MSDSNFKSQCQQGPHLGAAYVEILSQRNGRKAIVLRELNLRLWLVLQSLQKIATYGFVPAAGRQQK
jgi:hypothetical protein